MKSFTLIRGRSWRPGPIQTLLVTGFLALLGLIFAILIPDIHLAPDRLTLEKDAAELACLEAQSHTNDYHTETRSVPLAAADSAAIGRVDLLLEQQPQSETPKSALIVRRASSPDRKRNTDAGSVRKHLRPFKRDLAGPTRQRYEQKGPSSLFAALRHALGFSSN